MLSIISVQEVMLGLAQRVRSRRLRRGWTQSEIARRAGLKLATYVVFERSGRIALLRFLKILDVLGLMDEIDRIGRGDDLANVKLEDLVRPERKRGLRKRP